jgi:hypothetical protein
MMGGIIKPQTDVIALLHFLDIQTALLWYSKNGINALENRFKPILFVTLLKTLFKEWKPFKNDLNADFKPFAIQAVWYIAHRSFFDLLAVCLPYCLPYCLPWLFNGTE